MNAKLYALSKRHALADGAIQPGQLSVGFCRLLRLGRTRLVAGSPGFEFTGHVFTASRAQFGHDARFSGRLVGKSVLIRAMGAIRGQPGLISAHFPI